MSSPRSRLAALLLSGAVVALPSTLGAGSASADPAETNNQGATASHSAGPQLARVRSDGAAGGAASGQAKPTSGGARSNGIDFHGGPVITGTTNVYFIWYGNWAFSTAVTTPPLTTTILTDLAGSIGGQPYFNINTTYYNGSNAHVSNSVNYAGSTTDDYSQGRTNPTLSDAGVQAVVSSAITSQRLPKDTNGVYFVLTSSDVGESSGFLTKYCGWHTHGTIGGKDIKYSFVGDPAKNYSACADQLTSPNGNTSADAMASVLSHELEEAVTDPDLNAWYDRTGSENADKCAWTFGTTYSAAGGGVANMKLGTRDYLIQQNWVNASGGFCARGY